ncbi:MAG: hypothetical protein M0R51_11320 [Clostridia bacterium]|jgi:hypothetical protein|nr:hypothetical protein [Clostridia bacterium]
MSAGFLLVAMVGIMATFSLTYIFLSPVIDDFLYYGLALSPESTIFGWLDLLFTYSPLVVLATMVIFIFASSQHN